MPASESQPRICILGSINMDLVTRAPRLPAPGETILGGPFAKSPGGKGANQAVAAARMGGAVAFVGAVGEDEHGAELVAALAAEQIDTSRIARRAGKATGIASITVAEGGQNTIIVSGGANLTVGSADVDAARDLIHWADCLVLQLEVPLEAVTRAALSARELGTTVILNAAPARPLPEDLLLATDVLIVNETEGATLASRVCPTTDALLDRLTSLCPGLVVLTLGDQGSRFARETRGHIKAFPVSPIDTVGAGDAFVGALAVRWAELAASSALDSMGVMDAMCWASAAGALATLKHGAIPSMPRRDEVVDLLRRSP